MSRISNSENTKTTSAVMILITVAGLMRSSQNVTFTTYPILGSKVLHLNSSQIGLAATLSGLSTFVTMISFSKISRIFGRELIIFLGVSLLGITSLLFVVIDTKTEFLLVALLSGVGGGLAFPSLVTLLSLATKTRKSWAMAMFSSALSLSLILGPLIEVLLLLAFHGNLRRVFLYFALTPFLAAGLVLYYSRWVRSDISSETKEEFEKRAVAVISGENESKTEVKSINPKSALKFAIFIQIAYMIPFVSVVSFGGLYLRSFDRIDINQFSLYLSVFFLTSLLMRLLLVKRSPVHNPYLICGLAVVASITGLGALTSFRGIYSAIIGLAILGVPHGIMYPLSLSIVAENTPNEMLAKSNAQLAAFANLVPLVVPVLIGISINEVNYRFTFMLLALPVALFAVLAFISLRFQIVTRS